MKKIILAVAFAFVLLPLARGQDVDASPSPEESASPGIDSTLNFEPSATPSEEKPAAAEKSSPSTSEEKSSTATSGEKSTSPAETKKTSETTAAKPATTSTMPTAPSKKMSVEAAIKDNENRWEAAYMAHDISVAQVMMANDFVGVYWNGKVMSRSAALSEMKKDKDTYQSAKNESLKIHTYGPNVAVVVGTAREKGTGKDGQKFDRTYRFTDTWVDRNGRWQCVASQVMKLKG